MSPTSLLAILRTSMSATAVVEMPSPKLMRPAASHVIRQQLVPGSTHAVLTAALLAFKERAQGA